MSIEFYNSAIALKPEYSIAFNNKGISLFNLGKYDEALECFNKAIQLDPNNENAYTNRENFQRVL